MSKADLEEYITNIVAKLEDATEHTFRSDLENLLNKIKPDPSYLIINEANKDSEFILSRKPDFKIKKNALIVGYIETKPLNADLDSIIEGRARRDSEQFQDNLKEISNFILTDYNEVILFRDEIEVKRLKLFDTNFNLIEDNVDKFIELYSDFFSIIITEIKTPKKLSELLAKKAHKFKDDLTLYLGKSNQNEFKNRLLGTNGLFELFKETLIEDLEESQFLDAYVQTITYGLFLARMNSNDDLTLHNALTFIPSSMGIIEELFDTIKPERIPYEILWIIEEMINILNNIDLDKINENLSFSKDYGNEDPYIYFYENFLKEYDASERKLKGVYYTPIPVVLFIINSINSLLNSEFGKEGLTDFSVNALDFATGTGTFLLESFSKAINDIEKTDPGLKSTLIREHLLKNFYGLEYLIAPYTIAHLKLTQFLKENNYNLDEDERIKIFLTDTLDDTRHTEHAIYPKITEEGIKANEIKLRNPVLVVMGNPPYNSKSKNNKDCILRILEDYKQIDERNLQPLNNDYIKFIRYAQWKIDKSKRGIVGIITANSYLDGIIHRGMRENLLKSFDKLYILNLNGNFRTDRDENVFDISHGVSITIFVKLEESIEDKEVYYYSTYDNDIKTRKEKYKLLLDKTVETLDWTKLEPKRPSFWFTNKNLELEKEYYDENIFKGLLEIFKEYRSGIQTRRDPFTLHYDLNNLKNVINDLIDLDIEEIRTKYNLPPDGRDWAIPKAKNDVIDDLRGLLNKNIQASSNLTNTDWEKIKSERIQKIHYRPFDFKLTYFFNKSRSFIAYPTYDIAKQFIIGENLGLVSVRQVAENKIFNHAFVSDKIVDMRLTTSNRGTAFVFPFYLYQSSEPVQQSLIKEENNNSTNPYNSLYPKPNFTDEFIAFISNLYPSIPDPDEIFGYIYAILYSRTYRIKYNEFLKTDFSRIPFTDDYDKFKELSILGNKLVKSHTLTGVQIDASLARYPIDGNHLVDRIEFNEDTNRLYINENQYFDNIPSNIWENEMCGYKVLNKWLSEKKSNNLTLEDIRSFQKIVNSIHETLIIMEDIDNVYNSINFNV